MLLRVKKLKKMQFDPPPLQLSTKEYFFVVVLPCFPDATLKNFAELFFTIRSF